MQNSLSNYRIYLLESQSSLFTSFSEVVLGSFEITTLLRCRYRGISHLTEVQVFFTCFHQVSTTNDVKIYNLSAGKSLPDWLTDRKKRQLVIFSKKHISNVFKEPHNLWYFSRSVFIGILLKKRTIGNIS